MDKKKDKKNCFYLDSKSVYQLLHVLIEQFTLKE